jgi:hypothetical protein
MPYRLVQLSGGVPVWLGVVNIIGDLLWLVAYILIIRQGFKDRTYGIPMLCVALNFTWEFIYAVDFPFPVNFIEILRWAWLLCDVVIVYQLFRYGRGSQKIPPLKQYFYAICGLMFVSAYLGQLSFHYTFRDKWGVSDAYMINLVMSILFVFMYFSRPSGQGLSLGAAWAKMLGTGILSAGSMYMIKDWLSNSFMVYLYVTIFVFDVTYLALLYRTRAAAAVANPQGTEMLAAA